MMKGRGCKTPVLFFYNGNCSIVKNTHKYLKNKQKQYIIKKGKYYGNHLKKQL